MQVCGEWMCNPMRNFDTRQRLSFQLHTPAAVSPGNVLIGYKAGWTPRDSLTHTVEEKNHSPARN
jgi:hypothetical protein